MSGVLTLTLLVAAQARGDVVVLDNRSQQPVQFTVTPLIGDRQAMQYTAAQNELIPIVTRGRVDISFRRGKQNAEYRLDANAAYFFASEGDQLDLHAIGLGGSDETLAGREIGAAAGLEAIGTLPVKILVDDEQRFVRHLWESRLRKRVQAASRVLEKCCRIRLEVVAVETWDSDDQVDDVRRSLHEFVQEVDAAPARVAIGFTSQYTISAGKTRLGGTFGPLRSHILIQEWARHITEAERLELLIHELGHHLGAAHSPESDSVMRPMLGDRQARLKSFPIRFDPVNALAMYLLAEEIRLRNVRTVSDVSEPTKARLCQIYAELSRALPDDPVARKFLRLFSGEVP